MSEFDFINYLMLCANNRKQHCKVKCFEPGYESPRQQDTEQNSSVDVGRTAKCTCNLYTSEVRLDNYQLRHPVFCVLLYPETSDA